MIDSVTKSTDGQKRPWLIPAAVVVLAAVGITLGIAFAVNDNGDRVDTRSTSQIASVQQACQEWIDTDSNDRPSGDWCRNMAGWMDQQMADGDMTGSMMWGNPERLLDSCRQWAQSTDSTGDTQRCDDMVTWMRGQHAGADRRDGMMNDSMMDG